MSNYLSQITYNFKKARKELEKALETIESGESGDSNSGGKVNILQSLVVTDELADVFKDKPVFIFQSMDVRILQVSNKIQNALRALDKIDNASLKALGIKGEMIDVGD